MVLYMESPSDFSVPNTQSHRQDNRRFTRRVVDSHQQKKGATVETLPVLCFDQLQWCCCVPCDSASFSTGTTCRGDKITQRWGLDGDRKRGA